jgi:hypothetical protein
MRTMTYTSHARERQAQRNLSVEDVQFVWEYGRRYHNAGALHVFLGRRDLPVDKALYQRFARLEGTTLVLGGAFAEPVLITVYRNRRGTKKLRSKDKYRRCRAGR